MPSSSEKQHKFMNAIAHNKAFAKKVGVPQSVGQDFAKADKGRKFSICFIRLVIYFYKYLNKPIIFEC